MTRDLSTTIKTEAAKSSFISTYAIFADVDSDDPLYLTLWHKDLVLGSDNYIATGEFLKFSDIEEESSLDYKSISVEWTTPTFLLSNEFLNQSSFGVDKEVIIYRVFIDQDNNSVLDYYSIFKGFIYSVSLKKAPPLADGSKMSTLTCQISSRWADARNKRGRLTSDSVQQNLHPGDAFFNYVQATANQEKIVWGGG
jgi:hypothetical protein